MTFTKTLIGVYQTRYHWVMNSNHRLGSSLRVVHPHMACLLANRTSILHNCWHFNEWIINVRNLAKLLIGDTILLTTMRHKTTSFLHPQYSKCLLHNRIEKLIGELDSILKQHRLCYSLQLVSGNEVVLT